MTPTTSESLASPATFAHDYVAAFSETLQAIPAQSIERCALVLLDAYRRGAQVFVAGNGGSASLASHFACDLEKTTCGREPRKQTKRFRARSLCDNVATLTAWANDESYACVFGEQLRGLALAGDVLLVISASGNSPNVLEALKWARRLELTSMAWLGFDGGRALAEADCSIHVAVCDYGAAEAAHAVVAHLITSWLTRKLGAESSREPRRPLRAPIFDDAGGSVASIGSGAR
ncbi:MAG: SIS domain-containing protein [Proteobacteria bacterium]|nr:SIS domain-containing protein [Pseudomonadota bacterium]